MKKLIYSNLMLLALVCLPSLAQSKSNEVSKKYDATYTVNEDATLLIHNQFGKISLITWDQNTVSIEVEVTVEASNEEKANRKLEQIDIKMEGSESAVKVISELSKSGNFNGEFSIDMVIKSPGTLALDLKNEFGDVVMTEWAGPADIDVEYGTLNANKFTHTEVSIELEFSKGTVGLFNQAVLELEYCDRFAVNKAKQIELDAEFSKVEIETVERLTAKNEYGDLEVGSANRVNFSGEFCGFSLDELFVSGTFKNEYAGIKIMKVSKSFETLELVNSFSGTKVYFEPGSCFEFECTSEYGDVSVPQGSDLKIDKESTGEKHLQGSYGDGSVQGKVRARSEYGSITFSILN
jgi:hypothetical protein